MKEKEKRGRKEAARGSGTEKKDQEEEAVVLEGHSGRIQEENEVG